jgi:oxygen-independent coproporphyrinogen-3 oxidase
MDKLAQDLNRYHSQGKRYTYFPPVSTWKEANSIELEFEKTRAWSLYIHLPFCRELCTFCGCNIKITKDEEEQVRYVEALEAEFDQLKLDPPKGPFTLIIGGGSPNALCQKALDKLRSFLKNKFPEPSDSLCEIDPRSFNKTQANIFFDLGIKRFSFGVQDFNPKVLKNVNRNQTLDQLERTSELLRKHASFGIDLLWGMPLQENDPFVQWQEGLQRVKPDWINYYPMASVPWLEQVQNAYGDFTLPSQERKYELYSEGFKIFEKNNFTSIGMGHFLHQDSALLREFLKGSIHRSVSGLFFNEQEQVLGLGVSAISRTQKKQWQNQKIIGQYLNKVAKSQSTVIKVHENRDRDLKMSQYIKDVILENPVLSAEAIDIPEDWLTSDDKNTKSRVSLRGRHFKKNILQVLENDLFSK